MLTHRRDYLFKRPGSQFWRLRFQQSGRSVERSLKTTDKAEAEILALPLIAEHKRRLRENKPKLVPAGWLSRYQPGLHTLDDDQKFFATERELHFLDDKGVTIRTEPNGCESTRLVNVTYPLVITTNNVPDVPPELRKGAMVVNLDDFERPTVELKDGDDALVEGFIRFKKWDGNYNEIETRRMWELCKAVIKKPLKDLTRADARTLADHLRQQGDKDGTVRKKISRLVVAVGFLIKEGLLDVKVNPFSGIANEVKDAVKVRPLYPDDMVICREHLDELKEDDRLLFRVCATTGMRPSEAFQIDGERVEEGVRYVELGTKTESSYRRVPLPDMLLPHLPAKIKGKLFATTTKDPEGDAGKRINKWLREIGVKSDRSKVLYSLRHRAQDRMRAVECPEDIRHAVLGHEDKTIADNYGEGFPVTVLKKWIDKIGM